MKKIKLAFVTPKMIIGGAETYILTKANWLVTNGFDVIIISAGGENVKNLPIAVNHHKLDRIDDSPLVFEKQEYSCFISLLSNLLMENKVDIIESHNTYPAYHVAMSYKQTGIPFFINILNELSYVKNPLLVLLTKRLNRFHLYYTLTSEMNTFIEKRGFSKLNPVVLPIPVKGIQVLNNEIAEKYILSVSRMSKDKMYVKSLILDFYKLYVENDKAKEFKLMIVGDGELYPEVESLVNRVNSDAKSIIVELKGTVVGKNLEALYKKCFAFVGMGTALLLAASCGKPSIIAGFTEGTQSFSWGYWGENKLDKDIIGIGSHTDRKRQSLYVGLEVLIESKDRVVNAGHLAKAMFYANYDVECIMVKWQSEYQKILVHADSNTELSKSLRFDFVTNILRVVRKIYKKFKL